MTNADRYNVRAARYIDADRASWRAGKWQLSEPEGRGMLETKTDIDRMFEQIESAKRTLANVRKTLFEMSPPIPEAWSELSRAMTRMYRVQGLLLRYQRLQELRNKVTMSIKERE